MDRETFELCAPPAVSGTRRPSPTTSATWHRRARRPAIFAPGDKSGRVSYTAAWADDPRRRPRAGRRGVLRAAAAHPGAVLADHRKRFRWFATCDTRRLPRPRTADKLPPARGSVSGHGRRPPTHGSHRQHMLTGERMATTTKHHHSQGPAGRQALRRRPWTPRSSSVSRTSRGTSSAPFAKIKGSDQARMMAHAQASRCAVHRRRRPRGGTSPTSIWTIGRALHPTWVLRSATPSTRRPSPCSPRAGAA
ncbi:hypothetical protein QJS66_02455 [Kocuria rhizophila]|nr:hypothetical protein QJS66_02455 [Kocuria rhizophila]